MQKFSIGNYTKRNQFTRMCIGDAIIALMNEKEFDSIKISDITQKAGVSRMTFYKYYHTKEDVVSDYLYEVVAGYIKECDGRFRSDYPNYEQTLKAFQFFDRYSAFFLGMVNAGLYNLLINAVNQYMEERVIPFYNVPSYAVYYYAGALLNVFIKWEEMGKVEPAEKIARAIVERERKQ